MPASIKAPCRIVSHVLTGTWAEGNDLTSMRFFFQGLPWLKKEQKRVKHHKFQNHFLPRLEPDESDFLPMKWGPGSIRYSFCKSLRDRPIGLLPITWPNHNAGCHGIFGMSAGVEDGPALTFFPAMLAMSNAAPGHG